LLFAIFAAWREIPLGDLGEKPSLRQCIESSQAGSHNAAKFTKLTNGLATESPSTEGFNFLSGKRKKAGHQARP
jgi:hypothetical protein